MLPPAPETAPGVNCPVMGAEATAGGGGADAVVTRGFGVSDDDCVFDAC